MLNEYNGAITFLLQMNVLSGAEDIADWITDRSARATYESEEEKTRRFEWFLSADKAKATLIEVFEDSEGASGVGYFQRQTQYLWRRTSDAE